MGRHFPPPFAAAPGDHREATRRMICFCLGAEWPQPAMVAVAREMMGAIEAWPEATLPASQILARELTRESPRANVLRLHALGALAATGWPWPTVQAIGKLLVEGGAPPALRQAQAEGGA